MDELWVLEWGPYKLYPGNFHIRSASEMLTDNLRVMLDANGKVKPDAKLRVDTKHKLWIPVFIGTYEDCQKSMDVLQSAIDGEIPNA